ncbi:MAG: HPr(Ser) kinase/phosphatase [Candidatus Eisenbacteria bacterium]|nr:HPr(Ser) kinase/phosphatase [Candidatus Eisenbacteria bacterium]
MEKITAAKLYEDIKEELQLEQLTISLESKVAVTVSDTNRPGLCLAGFTDNFLNERIQILGQTEIAYLASLNDSQRKAAIDNLFKFPVPCIIVTKGLEVPEYCVACAEKYTVPLLRTPQSTTPFIHELTAYLDWAFAPETIVHGSLVDVYGIGLLFTGKSGIGKSECSLDLVERGHRLVADDVVTITKRHGDVLVGTGRKLMRHHMEIRGLGIIDVQGIFGIRSIRLQKRIEVEVNLQEWTDGRDYERIGLDDQTTTILDVKIPFVTIPIIPGKNITVIAEVVALNYLVKAYGYHPARELNRQLVELMKERSLAKRWVRNDLE